MMNDKFKKYYPKPNHWFSQTITHKGIGTARFINPEGTIKGDTTIIVNELGLQSVEMEVAEVDSHTEFTDKHFILFEFLSGINPRKIGTTTQIPIVMPSKYKNVCIELIVELGDGVFSAKEEMLFTCNIMLENKVSFSPIRASFISDKRVEPKYWVLPLLNFVSNLNYSNYQPFDNHPLRIFPTPSVESNLPDEDTKMANILAHQKNRLINFMFMDKPGYIEHLENYSEQKEFLENGKADTKLTCLMVGELPSQNWEDFDEFSNWLPLDYLPFLSLLIGVEVGAPWIEFRTAKGELVARHYVKLRIPLYAKGKACIDEHIHGNTGHLLTLFQASPYFRKSYFRVALKNLLRGGFYKNSIDNRLMHLFAVVDNLKDKIDTQKDILLKEENQRRIDEIIEKAGNEVQQIYEEEEAIDEKKKIERIIGNIKASRKLWKSNTQQMVDLFYEFDLCDLQILDSYLSQKSFYKIKSFSDLVARYRNKVMHQGYIEFSNIKNNFGLAIGFTDHLFDMLVRIIFKMLEYQGKYQPRMKPLSEYPIDWVTSTISISELGYKDL